MVSGAGSCSLETQMLSIVLIRGLKPIRDWMISHVSIVRLLMSCVMWTLCESLPRSSLSEKNFLLSWTFSMLACIDLSSNFVLWPVVQASWCHGEDLILLKLYFCTCLSPCCVTCYYDDFLNHCNLDSNGKV